MTEDVNGGIRIRELYTAATWWGPVRRRSLRHNADSGIH